MKHTFLSLLLCSGMYGAYAQSSAKPLTKLDVTVNGKQYDVNEGDTLVVDNKTIIVRTSQFMTFDFSALTFDYPKHFAYAFEEDFGYKNWTLDGNNLVITYFEFGVEVDMNSFVNELVKKFGKKNCTVVDKNVKLGGVELSGKRLNIKLLGERLTYDIYRLPTNDYKTHFLSFQDSKNADGSDSGESVETMDVINKTLKLK
jgi:hypothetical protein